MVAAFATIAEVQRKVGIDAATAGTDPNSDDFINQFLLEGESLINSTVRFNFSDAFAGLNTDVKSILGMALTAWAAIGVIRFDLDAHGRATALTMINSLLFEYNTAIAQLKDKKTEDFIRKA